MSVTDKMVEAALYAFGDHNAHREPWQMTHGHELAAMRAALIAAERENTRPAAAITREEVALAMPIHVMGNPAPGLHHTSCVDGVIALLRAKGIEVSNG